MKRLLAFFLGMVMVLSLFGCGTPQGQKDTKEQENFTEAPAVTLPDGSVIYSREDRVEFPQTGEFKETALLANVPGQGIPLLLDVRSDGTVDYIFADVKERQEFQSFTQCGTCYYTIAPDGSGTKQDTPWMAELDDYLNQTAQAAAEKSGKWFFRFAAEDGLLIILAQYSTITQSVSRSGSYSTRGEMLHNVLFKIEDGRLSIVPMVWKVEVEGRSVDLNKEYINGLMLESGKIVCTMSQSLFAMSQNISVSYHMDGTVADTVDLMGDGFIYMPLITVDENGMIVYHAQDADQNPETAKTPAYLSLYEAYRAHGIIPYLGSAQYTDDDSLYTLGMYPDNREMSEQWAQTLACGEDGTLYKWFNEYGQGLLVQYVHNPEGAIDPEIVTVWSWEHIGIVETAVALWNRSHASPIFRYVTAESELDTTDLDAEQIAAQEENYLTRLNLELANGQGPDVMILDGLNADSMMEFMAPLEKVNTAGVYGSLVDRFTQDGDLLAVPVRMTPYLLGRKAEGTEKIESLTQFADLITTSTGVLDMSGSDAYRYWDALYNIYSMEQVFELWYPAWADKIWEGGRLNKDVFAEFVEETNRLVEHYSLNDSQMLGKDPAEFRVYREEMRIYESRTEDRIYGNVNNRPFPYSLAATNHVGMFTYWWYENDDGNIPEPIPCIMDAIPGPDGSGVMVPNVIAAAREGGNEAAAQEFIQLLLSREIQLGMGYYNPTDADGYPVKWSYTEELLEATAEYMHQEFGVQNDYRGTLEGLRTVIIDETLYDASIYAAMHCYRDPDDGSGNPFGLSWETLTPGEAADLLEDLTRIYLAEQAR